MNRMQTMLTFAGVGTLILTVAVFLGFVVDRRAPSFDNVQQAYELIRTAGFHCASDRQDGRIDCSFVVSRNRLTWEEAGLIYKGGALGKWKGHVWIIAATTDVILYTTKGDTPPRIWGKVWAFGDDELLDEIERSSFR